MAAVLDTAMAAQAQMSRRAEYTALALMYVAQGLPAGLAFNALGVLIREGGHSVGAVGLAGLAFLPWALKFLWAGPVDNACARWGYAPVVGVTQGLAVLACLALVPFSPASQLTLALAGVVLLNTLCATQDIATNAYAVSRMQGRAAGAANAIQVAGFIAGMLAGGGGLLIVYEHVGWAGAMLGMAALMCLLYLPLLLGQRWRAAPPQARPATRVRLRDLREHTDLGWALAVALLFKFASTATGTLAQPWLVDRGLPVAQIGGLQMGTLVATALGGVFIGVPLVRSLGNRRALLVGCALSTLALGVPWALNAGGAQHPLALYSAAFALQALCDGAMYVALWALVMNWASPARPGTDYTVMQCSESLANAVAAGAIGGLGQRWGYGNAFAFAWLAGAVVLVLIALALPRMHLAHEEEEGRP
jgi:MFS transporter (putative signal transducer)